MVFNFFFFDLEVSHAFPKVSYHMMMYNTALCVPLSIPILLPQGH